jgi:hypothetical protein
MSHPPTPSILVLTQASTEEPEEDEGGGHREGGHGRIWSGDEGQRWSREETRKREHLGGALITLDISPSLQALPDFSRRPSPSPAKADFGEPPAICDVDLA